MLFRRSPRRPVNYRLCALVLLLALPAAARDDGRAGRHSADESLFSQKEYMGHITHLASDELEGRGTGQEGIDVAAEYIADYFKKHGVKPAGDEGTYFQNFTLKLKNKVADGTRLAIGTGGRKNRKPAKIMDDFVPFPFSGRGSFKGDVVFAGYGLTGDDFNDYDGLDVANKVVLVLRRAPGFMDADMIEHSFRRKARNAATRDAAAILIVNPPNDAEGDKLFDFETAMGGAGAMFGNRAVGIPAVHIRRDLAERMLKAADLPDLAALQKKIEKTKKPVSASLKGVSVRGEVQIEPVESPVRNIVGLIPGTGPQKDEIIILGGHYDHLGIRNKGGDDFNPEKDISNGADDNASGTALVMNMAKAYTKGKKPNRSILLMLFTAEELGLLGSYHFADHPTIDMSKAVAMLNFDMVGRLKNDKLEVGGMKTGGFEDMVMRLAEPYNLIIKDGGGGRGPSDHTSFYNKKIPVLFFFTGIHKQYHRPEDDTPLINGEGAIRICKYAADIIDEIDANPNRPKFNKDTTRASIARQDDDEPDQVASAAQPGGRAGSAGDARRAAFANRPRMGIRPDMDSTEKGVVLAEVMEDGPAAKAGLKEGDCITQVGKTKVQGMEDMIDAMRKVKLGDKVAIGYKRGDSTRTATVEFQAPREEVVARQDSTPPPPATPPDPRTPTSSDQAANNALQEQITAARRRYESKVQELETMLVSEDALGRHSDDINERVATLSALTTELEVDSLGKKSTWEALQEAKPEQLPITPDLAALLKADSELMRLENRLSDAEEKIAADTARYGDKDNPDVKAGLAIRDFLRDRLSEERAEKILQYQAEQIEDARTNFLESTDQLVRLKNQLDQSKGEQRDHEIKMLRYGAMQCESDRLRLDYDQLLNQQRLIDMTPHISRLMKAMRSSLGEDSGDVAISVTFDLAKPDAAPQIVFTSPAQARTSATEARLREELAKRREELEIVAKLRQEMGRSMGRAPTREEFAGSMELVTQLLKEVIQVKGTSMRQESDPKRAGGDVHVHDTGAAGDDVDGGEPAQMPPVRLGIMPTYGESEGEGYEISGVVEGGPAEKAGMKDADRILRIGSAKITNVYEYMDALRKFKPGQEVPVTVLRNGKKVVLKIKATPQKSREAA